MSGYCKKICFGILFILISLPYYSSAQYSCPVYYLPANKILPKKLYPDSILLNYPFPDKLSAVIIRDTSRGFIFDKVGFMNVKGQLVIPATYDTLVHGFKDGMAIVGNYEVYNKSGIRRRRMRVRMNYGMINTTNQLLVPVQYRKVNPPAFSFVPVLDNKDRWGFYLNGKMISNCQWDRYEVLSTRYILTQKYGRYSLLNEQGEEIVSNAQFVSLQGDSIARAGLFHNYEIRNNKDSLLFHCDADKIVTGNTGWMFYYANNYKGTINLKGHIRKNSFRTPSYYIESYIEAPCITTILTDTILYPFVKRFDKVYSFCNGYAMVMRNGRYGFIDDMGNIKVSVQYTNCTNFSDGYAAVILKGKWAMIDKEENIVVQPYYTYVGTWRKKTVNVANGKKWYLVGTNGKEINKQPYDSIKAAPYDKWWIYKGAFIGLADNSGLEIMPTRYESILDLNNGFYIVRQDGKYGVIDYKQNFVLPYRYDKIEYDRYNDLYICCTYRKNKTTETIIQKTQEGKK